MNFKIIFGKWYHQVPAEDFSYALLCVAYDYTSKSNISAKETNDLMVEVEDFGKRNMSGKRVRKHFSPFSEFERGLIIGMKTTGWSTSRVAGQVDRSESAVKNVWEQWTREVTCSPIPADVGIAIVKQTISRQLAEANLKSKRPFRALPLKPKHRQLRLQWSQARSMWNVTDWQKVVFSD
ncbi:transposable element Tc1 transposase [Trichonephila clavipes]|nr:transposable element Tc1 transposase [Trichonephila clavipes]